MPTSLYLSFRICFFIRAPTYVKKPPWSNLGPGRLTVPLELIIVGALCHDHLILYRNAFFLQWSTHSPQKIQSEVSIEPSLELRLTLILIGHFLLQAPHSTQSDLSDVILSCGIFSHFPIVKPPTKNGDIQQMLWQAPRFPTVIEMMKNKARTK